MIFLFTWRDANSTNQIAGYRSRDHNWPITMREFSKQEICSKITRSGNNIDYRAIWLVESAFLIKKKKFKNRNFETNFSTLSPLTCYYVFFSWEHLIISFLLVSFPSTLFPSLAPLLSGYSQLYASFIYPPPYTLPLLQTHCRVPVSP